jgi:DNA-directed RNA polymerase specialized sigma24 family protein
MYSSLSTQGSTRAAKLHEEYSARLMGILRNTNPTVDQDDISDAIIDAIMSTTSKGTQEDMRKGKFISLLKRMAQNRIIDRIRKRQRRQQRELKKVTDSVTNQPSASNEVDDAATTQKLVERYSAELATTDDERKYLLLWMENHSHESIIDQFCSAPRTREEAAALVRQLSDRLRQRVSRLRKQVAKEDQP